MVSDDGDANDDEVEQDEEENREICGRDMSQYSHIFYQSDEHDNKDIQIFKDSNALMLLCHTQTQTDRQTHTHTHTHTHLSLIHI